MKLYEKEKSGRSSLIQTKTKQTFWIKHRLTKSLNFLLSSFCICLYVLPINKRRSNILNYISQYFFKIYSSFSQNCLQISECCGWTFGLSTNNTSPFSCAYLHFEFFLYFFFFTRFFLGIFFFGAFFRLHLFYSNFFLQGSYFLSFFLSFFFLSFFLIGNFLLFLSLDRSFLYYFYFISY